MFCTKCGIEQSAGSEFCHECGNKLLQTNKSGEVNDGSKVKKIVDLFEPSDVENAGNSKAIIKCGNCNYVGTGKLGRSILGEIFAWLCILFFWPVTLIYYLATSRYRCPKCDSTFLGVKNKQGVFTQQKKLGVLGVILVVLAIIAVVGLLSTLAVVSLNNARMKARDAKRISDVKQTQTALELYHIDNEIYPKGLYNLSDILSEPINNPTPNDGNCDVDFEYEYTQLNNGLSYKLEYCLGEDTSNVTAGYNIANPDGMAQGNKLFIPSYK
jgi:type II secretory pathway pseudopilin PulG